MNKNAIIGVVVSAVIGGLVIGISLGMEFGRNEAKAVDNYVRVGDVFKYGNETDRLSSTVWDIVPGKSYDVFQFCGFTDAEIQDWLGEYKKRPDYYRVVYNETTALNDIQCGEGLDNHHYGVRSYVIEIGATGAVIKPQ